MMKVNVKNKIQTDDLDELRELRKKTINRWKKAGLLEGIVVSKEIDICKLFKSKEIKLINEKENEMDT